MTVETATYLSDLNPLLPDAADGLTEGDNHLRLLKAALQATFPSITGAITKTHTEINNAIEATAALTALAALTPADGKLVAFSGASTAELIAMSDYAKTLLDDVDAATARTTLGLLALATKATVATADIDNDAVTFAKLQTITDARLIGRSAGSDGDAQHISVGTGLSLAAGVLTATGKTAQVQTTSNSTYQTCGTIIPSDDSLPQSSEGDQILSLSFTPTNAGSTLEIEWHATFGGSAGRLTSALFAGGASAIAMAGGLVTNVGQMITLSGKHFVSAGSIAARTYSVRAGDDTAADIFLNGDSAGRLYGGASVAWLSVKEHLP